MAQRISSINSVSAICEYTGANIEEVAEAVGTDSRIEGILEIWSRFWGSCFKRYFNLVYILSLGLKEVAQYWESLEN